MENLFLYGTLRDRRLCEIVLGRKLYDDEWCFARLQDHCVYYALGENYPVITHQNGQIVEGILLRNLSDFDTARINYYEAGFGYYLSPVTVENQNETYEANVYYCAQDDRASNVVWSIDEWRENHAILQRSAAVEFMGYFGTPYEHNAVKSYGRIVSRAYAKICANKIENFPLESGPNPDPAVQVKDVDYEHLGFFALNNIHFCHRKFDQEMSEPKVRSVFYGGDAALVLPYDPNLNKVVLVEQFRIGPFGRGDKMPWVYEPIAGMIDVGETAQQTAIREAQEEAELEIKALFPVGEAYPSPGEETTFFHMYVGITDLSNYKPQICGAQDEGEDIKPHIFDFDTVLDWAKTGQLRVLPLQTMVLWLALNKTNVASNEPV